MQDKAIIEEFQQGDKDAFQLLFNMLYPVMCLFARKFTNDYDNAEDIAQDVFIELWNRRVKFVSLDQIKAFLYLSIKNRCLNYKKHQVVKEKYVKEVFATESEADEYLIETEVVNQLTNVLNTLPDQQKNVIILSMQGLKNDEIAQNMRLSVNTVKLYKKIAYEQLRSKLGPSIILLLSLIQ
jgi:RNA polymerase sigma-70 factor (family 1)